MHWGAAGLPPGGDAPVEGVGMIFAVAFGAFRFAVEHIDGVVIGGVLPGWRSTRCTGCWLGRSAGRISSCGIVVDRMARLKLLFPCVLS
jgi:hypothetical protein